VSVRAALLGALAALSLACAERQGTATAADVDGHAIPLETLRRAVDARLDAEPGAKLEEVAGEELERLIDEQVVLNRAEALSLQISPAEVENRILLVHGEGFAADPAYQAQVRREMLLERTALTELVGALQVSPQELLDYFERNRAGYAHPERVQIRQIVVADAQRARELHAKLRAGADFSALARENSLGPEARNGGLLPAFAAGELPEVFDRAFQLKPGQTSEVIESPHGYHIFLLVDKIPAQEAEFQTVREELLGRLRRQRLTELRPAWTRELRRKAKIAVNERLLEDLRR
jgi:parvulin-like peptidyl-prolyl isomerase